MNRTAIVNLFAFLLVLAIPDGLSTTRFVLLADAWSCVPTSTTSRESVNKAKITIASRSRKRELNLPRAGFLLSPEVPWYGQKHGSISSLLSSSSPYTTTTILTSTIEAKQGKIDLKPNDPNQEIDLFFIRPALFVDMDRASKILADGFFKGPRTNWFTYQYEKFITYLSLEANFPKNQQQRSRYEIYVASCVETGEVWGFVEIDARGTMGERTSKVYEKSGGSPYMCNLAVDERHQRKGIASSLVYECERQVKEWYSDDESRRIKKDAENINNDTSNTMVDDMMSRSSNNNMPKAKSLMSNSVCLKVRESNTAAVQMYLKLGYVTVYEEIEDQKTGENVFLMRKEMPTLSPPPLVESE